MGQVLFLNLFFHVKLQTMSVLTVMRSLRSELEAGNIKPYCFVEINGLKLASPENIYKVKFTKKYTGFGLYDHISWLLSYGSDIIFRSYTRH